MLKRSLMRYHGGKWRLAPWIISHFPQHRIYVEPFGGAASVLLRKARSYGEVYNDLDGEMVNLFRVLRNPAQASELVRLVTLTPYAREEFEESAIVTDDPVEQARRTLIRASMGYSTGAQLPYGTGFRGNVTRSYTTPALDWRNYPATLDAAIDRLRGVVIEHRPALDVIQQYDGPETLFYVDPPYVYETRNPQNAGMTYRHEMTDEQHAELAGVLRQVRGMVVLSGYPCRLYEELYGDWRCDSIAAHADGAKDRTEMLWINHNTPVQQELWNAP